MFVLLLYVTLSLYGVIAFDIVFYIGYEVDGLYAVNDEWLLTSYIITMFRLLTQMQFPLFVWVTTLYICMSDLSFG